MDRLRVILTVLCAVAVISAPVGFAEEFFEDNFDGYADDLDVTVGGGWQFVDVNNPVETSTWTILNPGGRGNPPGEDGAPSTGQFLISDSDAQAGSNPTGSGMSHDLWSPIIELSAATDVAWLHFNCTAQLNNNGKAVYDVDVSEDEGKTWTNLFRRVAPSRTEAPPRASTDNVDGVFGRQHIDLSEFVGVDVIVRWRHFEPNFDWWIAIDDVLVDDVPPPQGGDCNLLARTDFSGGIPEGWLVRSDAVPANTGTETWSTEDKGRRSVVEFNGGAFPYQDGRGVGRLVAPFAIIDSDADPDPIEDEWLLTPLIDCSDAEEVFLHYKEEIVPTGAVQEVLVSIDGGEVFEPVPIFSYGLFAGFDAGEEPFYAERVFSVPVASLESEVVFAFHYASGGNEWYWAVDDVQISATLAEGGSCPCTCVTRGFSSTGFNPDSGEVTLQWNSCDDDRMHRIVRNGESIGELAGDATSFQDRSPPADQECPLQEGGRSTFSVYFLETVGADGELLTRCGPICLEPRRCPSGLSCCYDRDTGEVSLNWSPGVNVAGSSWRIRRNGIPRTSLAIEASEYREAIPQPGTYEYTLELNGGDAAQCPGLPLRCLVVVPGEDILLFEDFNCYTSNEDVIGAGWQSLLTNDVPGDGSQWQLGSADPGNLLGNSCGRGAPPTQDGSPSVGGFLISDNDCGGADVGQGTGQSYDLVSPAFDASAVDTVWLHLDMAAVLNNNGSCVVDIDVSTDDGATWTNVFRRVAHDRGAADPLPLVEYRSIDELDPGGDIELQGGNMDGVYGRVHVDLTEVAAGASSAQFRVRHFEPGFDWWVSIDNVSVDTIPHVGGNVTLLETETFEDGELPDGWEQESLSGDGLGPWQFMELDSFCTISTLNASGGALPDAAAGRSLHWFDRQFAFVAFDELCAPVLQDELLLMPTVDCSEVDNVYLHFRSAIVFANQIASVGVSLDGGVTFDWEKPLFTYGGEAGFLRNAGNAEVAYGEYILEVPEAAGQSDVVFGFRNTKQTADAAWWAVDDVRVSADGEAPGGGFVRGDSNSSGSIDLTDGVVTLNFLFTGGPPPGCLDAADTDDSGALVISDAVITFSFLFTGGPPPAEPSPSTGNYVKEDCGSDPTDDGLDCVEISVTCS